MPGSFERMVNVIEKAAKREHHRLHHKVLRKRHPHARKGAGATGLTHRRRVHSKPYDYANFGKGYSDGAPNLLGRIVDVTEGTLGSYLSAAASAGDAVLNVDDAIDFDGDGGTLTIGAETLAYTTADESANTVSLTGTLASPHGAETQVALSPLTTERWAHVLAVDEPDGEDTMAARVPHALYDRVAVGVRDASSRESVECAFFGDDLVVTDVTGKVPAWTLPLHHITHEPGGNDAIKLSDLISGGFLKTLSGNLTDFMRGDGNWASTPGGGGSPSVELPYRDIQAFAVGSGQTWTKPTGFTARIVTVFLVGGGAGGGGGALGVGAGGGGGGGGVMCVAFNAADLPATVNVDVGAGGSGGAVNTQGGDGAQSRFGVSNTLNGTDSFFFAGGGLGGKAGSGTRGGGLGGGITGVGSIAKSVTYQAQAASAGGTGSVMPGSGVGTNGGGAAAPGGGAGGGAANRAVCAGGGGGAGKTFTSLGGGSGAPGIVTEFGLQSTAGGGGGGNVSLGGGVWHAQPAGNGGYPGGGGGGGASARTNADGSGDEASAGAPGGDGLVIVVTQ